MVRRMLASALALLSLTVLSTAAPLGDTMFESNPETVLSPLELQLAPPALGTELAVSGLLAVATDPTFTSDGFGSGIAVAWRYLDGSWHQTQVIDPDPGFEGVFGTGLALDGDTLAIVARGDFGDSDLIYVYRDDGTAWVSEAVLVANQFQAPGLFNPDVIAIALDGNTLAVSAEDFNDAPIIVLERTGSAWAQTAALELVSTSIQADALALQEGDVLAAVVANAVRIYTWNGAAWQYTQLLPLPLANVFPDAVHISGDRLVVSQAATDSGSMQDVGAVFAFERSGGQWSASQTIMAPTLVTNAAFGRSVALDGDRLAIGEWAPTFQTPRTVYAYRHDGAAWVLEQTFTPPALGANGVTSWGGSCALSGAHLLAGFNPVLAAYEATGPGGAWAATGLVDATATTVAETEYGAAIDRQGTRMVVGAPNAGPDGGPTTPRTGVAVVHVLNGSTWAVEAVLTAPDGAAGDRFGDSVALDGDRIVVGAPKNGIGAAYVFVLGGGGWSFEQQLAPFGGLDVANFGNVVDVDAARIAVAARGGPAKAGAAFTYQFNGAGWSPRTALVEPEQSQPGDLFGWSLALDRVHLAVGARARSVSVFVDLGGWVVEDVLPPPPMYPDSWGWSVALCDSDLAVGAPYAQPALHSGLLTIFRRDGATWTPVQELWHGGNEREHLGFAVDIAGDLVVATTSSGPSGGHDYGIWLLQRENGTWSFLQEVVGSGHIALLPTSPLGLLGAGVVVDAAAITAGAPEAFDPLTVANPGAALVFSIDHQPASFCWGDGSNQPCPCGNAGAAEEGCAHSAAFGARLENQGTTSLAAGDLLVEALQLPPQKPGLFFAGIQPIAATLGDGILCVAPQFRGPLQHSGAGGAFALADLGTLLGASPGEAWYVQAWYRDPQGPCGAGVNTTSGFVVTFTP